MKLFNIAVSSLAMGAAAIVSVTAIPTARAALTPSGSVFDVLSADPRFTTTMQMVYVAGSANRLSSAGELTVFAPTDTGWASSSDTGKLSALSSTGADSEFPDSAGIVQIIRGFFVHSAPPTGAAEVSLRSAAGKEIDFDPKSMEVKWVAPDGKTKSAHVDGQPIVASNGVVYPVDAVVGE